MFSYSQDERERNLNLTYPPFKLNGLRKNAAPGFLLKFYSKLLMNCSHKEMIFRLIQ